MVQPLTYCRKKETQKNEKRRAGKAKLAQGGPQQQHRGGTGKKKKSF